MTSVSVAGARRPTGSATSGLRSAATVSTPEPVPDQRRQETSLLRCGRALEIAPLSEPAESRFATARPYAPPRTLVKSTGVVYDLT